MQAVPAAIHRPVRSTVQGDTDTAIRQEPQPVHYLIRASSPSEELTHLSVLFTDVRGFTTLSERLPPDELMIQLNRFYSLHYLLP